MVSNTRVVCTIGPASDNVETLKKMMQAGMTVARFNFQHGTHDEHEDKLKKAIQAREELNMPLGTMMDMKGPEIRFRDFEGGSVIVKDGQQFVLKTSEVEEIGTTESASISYKHLWKDIQDAMNQTSNPVKILVNDGLIEMTAESIDSEDHSIHCRVVHGGKISNHKAINVPSIHLSMPVLSEVDKNDLDFASKMRYDYVAASFVRDADDILAIRKFLADRDYYPWIISKIENQEGIDNLDEIIDVSDGLMVARGDMGVEIPMEKVPEIQKDMIEKCLEQGKFVITATNMLESMTHSPRPTRAEVNDVANAVYDGTTAVMLSGESAAGDFPVESVSIMARTAAEAEKSSRRNVIRPCIHTVSNEICRQAVDLAEKTHAKAILALTMSGQTANLISLEHTNIPVIACCTSRDVMNKLQLSYGIQSIKVGIQDDEQALYNHVIQRAVYNGLIKIGDLVVIVAGIPLKNPGTNTIKIVKA